MTFFSTRKMTNLLAILNRPKLLFSFHCCIASDVLKHRSILLIFINANYWIYRRKREWWMVLYYGYANKWIWQSIQREVERTKYALFTSTAPRDYMGKPNDCRLLSFHKFRIEPVFWQKQLYKSLAEYERWSVFSFPVMSCRLSY